MTAPSPDDLPGLVEAVAEAMWVDDVMGDGLPREVVVAEYPWPSPMDGLADAYRQSARAAVAAMVEHLGLVEEQCCDHIDDGAYRCVEIGFQCISRLAQPWPDRTEVDHGSE